MEISRLIWLPNFPIYVSASWKLLVLYSPNSICQYEGGRVVLWSRLYANFAIKTIGKPTELLIASISRPTSFP